MADMEATARAVAVSEGDGMYDRDTLRTVKAKQEATHAAQCREGIAIADLLHPCSRRGGQNEKGR